MNNFFKRFALVVSCTVVIFSAHAQNSHTALQDVVNAIKANNVEDMSKYIGVFVTISINNGQSIYSHNQATVVLHDFFEKNDARDMLIMDSGTANNSSIFVIGAYNTAAGNKYTVYVLMKKRESKYVLQEMRMNKE